MSTGKLIEELAELAPLGDRRMGANPHANGGAAQRLGDAGLQKLRGAISGSWRR